jgi:hypothetical protein
MPTNLVITPLSETPSATPSNTAQALDDLLTTHAQQHGVNVDAFLDVGDAEIWISDIHRTNKSLKGSGKSAIRDVQSFAREHGLEIGLAFWAENAALRDYYTGLGFRIVAEPTEDDLDGPDDHAIARWTADLDTGAQSS